MEEQDKKLIILTAKNQLCLALSPCPQHLFHPQHLFFHPQLSLLSAVSLSRRLISSLLHTNTLIFCFLHHLHVTKLIQSHCQPIQPRTTSKQIEEKPQSSKFPKGLGIRGNIHSHPEERNAQKKPRAPLGSNDQWTWEC